MKFLSLNDDLSVCFGEVICKDWTIASRDLIGQWDFECKVVMVHLWWEAEVGNGHGFWAIAVRVSFKTEVDP